MLIESWIAFFRKRDDLFRYSLMVMQTALASITRYGICAADWREVALALDGIDIGCVHRVLQN